EATSSSTAQAKPSSSQRLARMVSFFMKFISRTSCTKPSVVDAGDGFAIHQQVNVEQHDHVVLAREDAVDGAHVDVLAEFRRRAQRLGRDVEHVGNRV